MSDRFTECKEGIEGDVEQLLGIGKHRHDGDIYAAEWDPIYTTAEDQAGGAKLPWQKTAPAILRLHGPLNETARISRSAPHRPSGSSIRRSSWSRRHRSVRWWSGRFTRSRPSPSGSTPYRSSSRSRSVSHSSAISARTSSGCKRWEAHGSQCGGWSSPPARAPDAAPADAALAPAMTSLQRDQM